MPPNRKRIKKLNIKLVAAHKNGLKADDILQDIAHDNHQTITKETKLHYEEKLVDQIKVNNGRFLNYTRHFIKSSSIINDIEFDGKHISDINHNANNLNDFVHIYTYR